MHGPRRAGRVHADPVPDRHARRLHDGRRARRRARRRGSRRSARAQRRADWRDFEPTIFVETPGVGAVSRARSPLSGTASVFEGSFQARLVDSSGRRIVERRRAGQRAARPERGGFAKVVPFSTSAQRGTLIVFDQSMEDGSRQDEVQHPRHASRPTARRQAAATAREEAGGECGSHTRLRGFRAHADPSDRPPAPGDCTPAARARRADGPRGARPRAARVRPARAPPSPRRRWPAARGCGARRGPPAPPR